MNQRATKLINRAARQYCKDENIQFTKRFYRALKRDYTALPASQKRLFLAEQRKPRGKVEISV